MRVERGLRVATAIALAGLVACEPGSELDHEGASAGARDVPELCADLVPGGEPELPDGLRHPGADLLLVTVDTLRADHLGAWGYGRHTSPALDAFAAGSTRFEHAYSTGPWTVPTLGSVLTGTYPDTHRANFHTQIDPRLTNLAELLSSRGYRTAAHVSSAAPTERIGMLRGFDTVGGEPRRLEEILRWVRSSPEPYFLWLHFIDPHAPYDPDPEILAPFHAGPVKTDLATRTYAAGECPDLEPGDLEQIVALYDGEIVETDRDVGELLAALREMPRWSSTIVALTADHGEELFERGQCGHGHALWQEQIHVPLILRVPGVEPRRVREVASLVDLAPSLLALLDVPVPDTMQGRARLAALASPATAERPGEAYLGMDEDRNYALVRGDTKLLRHWGDDRAWRVFDLTGDPGERDDRYDPVRHAPLVERLACYREVLAHAHGRPRVPALTDEVDEERLRALGYLTEPER